MDYLDYSLITGNFLNALKSKYSVSEDIKFNRLNKNIFEVSLKDETVLGVDYFVTEGRILDIEITNYDNLYTSERRHIFIFNFHSDTSLFKEVIIKMLEEVEFKTDKETNIINNAQEIIEITKKAKEENIKKDIENLESKILEAARNGKEIVMFRLSYFKTNLDLMNKDDNEIVKHFRNKGFECSINKINHYMAESYLVIKWGD